jgi:hypothetical protein
LDARRCPTAVTVRKVDYYHIMVPDAPGEVFRILSALNGAGVNLLACCGFPIGEGRAQIDLVPEDEESFRRATAKIGLPLSEPKRAFLVQGEDRVGAQADVFAKLAGREINIIASQAVSAGAGRWGMILWVKLADYERAGRALGL